MLTIIAMEGIAWLTHRYLMHGPLWFIHKTHHTPRHGRFELNDVFGILFGVISISCIFNGIDTFSPLFWIGIGISIYGLLYFIAHDIIVHRRLKLGMRMRGRSAEALRKAHLIHHKTITKNGSEEFGFLFVHPKHLK
ncbi:MAG: sterol desaturase family protein [Candidatus Kapaibacteriota bacterium]